MEAIEEERSTSRKKEPLGNEIWLQVKIRITRIQFIKKSARAHLNSF